MKIETVLFAEVSCKQSEHWKAHKIMNHVSAQSFSPPEVFAHIVGFNLSSHEL